jgi:hypothetical protein
VAVDREQRRNAARNQSLFREVNERIEDISHPHDYLEFLCECCADDCTESVQLSLEEYETVRRHPTHFVILPGHEAAGDVERVVGENNRYLVVEKTGEAGLAAVKLDPRRRGTTAQ